MSGVQVAGDRAGAGEGGGPPQRRKVWSLQRVGLVVAVAAALAIIPFGGWSTKSQGLQRLELNQTSAGLPWNVTVTGGRLVDDQPPLQASVEGNRWVIILARVEVTSDTSRVDIYDALRISGAEGLVDGKAPLKIVPGIAADPVAVSSDFAQYVAIHPGLPEDMVFAWEQSASAPVPTQVDVTLWGINQRRSSLTGSREWLDPVARAVVTVQIVDRRGA
jgi:hypothetical protein